MMLTYVHKDRNDNLNCKIFYQIFDNVNDRRIKHFGQ